MPNLASALKSEIMRLARKELKAQTDGFKKSIALHRSEIAALKKQVRQLEVELRRATSPSRRRKSAAAAETSVAASAESNGALRFRAQGLATNRKRLGLSAADFGLLVGTTGQSIYAWELGKAKPRAQYLAAIAALRGVGKRDVEAKLAELKG